MRYRDHFSKQSKEYAVYRPGYPEELFAYLNTLVRSKDTGKNPIDLIEPALRREWGDPYDKLAVHWDIYLNVGRKGA